MTGKTSLFTILTGVHQETRIGSTAVRTGVTKVPDPRLEALAKIFEPPKITHASVEYADMPSISKESLRDPSYLASLRVVDAYAHVLRFFKDETVPHEKGSVDPLREHTAGHHQVGPVKIGLCQILGVPIDKPTLPRCRQKSRNGDQAKRSGRKLCAKDLASGGEIPKGLPFECWRNQ